MSAVRKLAFQLLNEVEDRERINSRGKLADRVDQQLREMVAAI
jgi:hypothetical protein